MRAPPRSDSASDLPLEQHRLSTGAGINSDDPRHVLIIDQRVELTSLPSVPWADGFAQHEAHVTRRRPGILLRDILPGRFDFGSTIPARHLRAAGMQVHL